MLFHSQCGNAIEHIFIKRLPNPFLKNMKMKIKHIIFITEMLYSLMVIIVFKTLYIYIIIIIIIISVFIISIVTIITYVLSDGKISALQHFRMT